MAKKIPTDQKFTIRYSEGVCIVTPPHDAIRAMLTYTKKTLETDPRTYRKVTKRIQTPMFVEEKTPTPAIRTFGGFFYKIFTTLLSSGADVDVVDERNAFPPPNLQHIGGFMHTQREIFLKIVNAGMSGVADLVTRYGKTMIIANLCRAYKGLPIIVMTDGSDPLRQLFKDLKGILTDRDIVMIGGGSSKKTQSSDISVVSYDSLHLCSPTKTRLIIGDEIHTLPVDSRIPEWVKFMGCRRFGLTGSPEGRFDGRDPLIEGLVGPVIARRKYRDALADGAICELQVLALRVPTPEVKCGTRDAAYKGLLFESPDILGASHTISTQILSPNTQAIFFISNEKQADALALRLGKSAVVAMAKKLTNKQRADLVGEMRSADIKRCISSEIFATGMTFQDLAVVVNLSGGGSSTSCVQKPGRLLQNRPGKKCGVLIEFFFDVTPTMRATKKYENPLADDDRLDRMRPLGDTACLHRDSVARFEVYEKNGYTIHYFDSLADLQHYYQTHCV